MFFAGFPVERNTGGGEPRAVVLGLLLTFVAVPLIQGALAWAFVPHEAFRAGIVFASFMPVAMVAPYFSARSGADARLSFKVMFLSMFAAPLLAPAALTLFGASLPIRAMPLILSLGLFISVPTGARWCMGRWWPRAEKALTKYLWLANAVCLAALVFVIVGAAQMRINLHYVGWPTILALVALAFTQDFGAYFLARGVTRPLLNSEASESLAISVGMKNVAVSAGVMYFYWPQAALPSVLGFVAHACYFTWLETRAAPRAQPPR
jgi:predicted Na+-dependent transporter